MMKVSHRAWFTLAVSVFSLLTSCDRVGPTYTAIEETKKVVFLSARGNRSFELGQRLLMAQFIGNHSGFEFEVQDAGLDAAKQRDQLEAAIAAKPFAILLDPLDPPDLQSAVKAAVDAGILTLGFGEDSLSLGCSSSLYTDQKKLGQKVGELVIHALKAKALESGQTDTTGRVVEIRGDEVTPNCQRLHDGFEAALKTVPGVILVHDAPGGWTQAGGQERTQDALRLQHSFDIVFAHDDLMALGASDALKDRRSDLMILGINGFRGDQGGTTLVDEGRLDATVYQPMLVDFAWLLIKKKAQNPSFTPKPRYEMTFRTILPKDVNDIYRNGLPALPEL